MVYTGALQRDYERLNMMTLQEFLEKQFDENLMLAVLSGQRSKEKEAPSKVRIRQIELKGSVCYQASSTVGTKVLHSNYSICGTEFSGGWIFPAAGAGKMQRWQCSCQQKG